MKTEAIVVAAGISKRLNGKVRKPYLNLSGRPILVHTLKRLNNSNKISNIVVVVNKLDLRRCTDLVKKFNIKKVKKIIEGGKKRQDSVYNGLKSLDEDTDTVLIHDGVRPFIDKDIIRRSIDCARKFGACVIGVPVKATIKKTKNQPSSRGHFLKGELGSEGKPTLVPRTFSQRGTRVRGKTKNKTPLVIEKTIDRNGLWEIQTPQVFRKEIILKAYKKFGNLKVTDDAMLVEKLGVEVRIVMGSYKNIKITTSEDLAIAEGILKCA